MNEPTKLMLFAIAVILLGARLPAYTHRIGMSRKEQLQFSLMIFGILLVIWFVFIRS